MNLDWLANPAVVYSGFAAVTLANAWLFITCKLDTAAAEKRLARRIMGTDTALAELATRVDETMRRLQAPAPGPEPLHESMPERRQVNASLNLTTRSQALRLHRCGESTDAIAAALGIPRNEVDLLVKIHRILLENYEVNTPAQQAS